MATTCVAPGVETTEAEIPVEDKALQVKEPGPAGGKRHVRDLLVAIFQGHEEYLGWTPD
jgi:hypothetical protein